MARIKRQSDSQYHASDPDADVGLEENRDNWAFPLHPERPDTAVEYMSRKHTPPAEVDHPCIYSAIRWDCIKCDSDSQHKGFCVTLCDRKCANFDDAQKDPYVCCKEPRVIIVEERKGFCYGPYCPGFGELSGKDKPVPNPPYRFNTWFYLGKLPDVLWPKESWPEILKAEEEVRREKMNQSGDGGDGCGVHRSGTGVKSLDGMEGGRHENNGNGEAGRVLMYGLDGAPETFFWLTPPMKNMPEHYRSRSQPDGSNRSQYSNQHHGSGFNRSRSQPVRLNISQNSSQNHGSSTNSDGDKGPCETGERVVREWSFPSFSRASRVSTLPSTITSQRCLYEVKVWSECFQETSLYDLNVTHTGFCVIKHVQRCGNYRDGQQGPYACHCEFGFLKAQPVRDGVCLGEGCPGLEGFYKGQKRLWLPDIDYLVEFYYGNDARSLASRKEWLLIARAQEQIGVDPRLDWKDKDKGKNQSFVDLRECWRRLNEVKIPTRPHIRPVASLYPN
ncbi:hypothetical protein NHQ30_005404 [Ciborinia camelliae]|nr:hypothetical protein NHQ30_005404 [Ciborinia camelliae]